MTFAVEFSPAALADLDRLLDHLLDRAEYVEDLVIASQAHDAIQHAARCLQRTPLLYRRAPTGGPMRRQLVVPFGAQGYVLEYEVVGPSLVVVLGVRHQREQDAGP